MAKTNYNKMSNKSKEDVKKTPELIVDDLVPEVEPVVEETTEAADVPQVTMPNPIGVVVDCVKLNVRNNPHPNAHIELTIDKGTEVEIVRSEGDFYFVRKDNTTKGFNGWCMKKYISIK